MQKRTAVEMERHRIAKVTRAMLRLKYSLMADEAINEMLPETLSLFDKAVQSGELQRYVPNIEGLLHADHDK